ncbi:uncharacterized protein LACBIDRAFT_318132 [Laccaria bicolor S238N-H82]|uniref:Predicted protein n=1 Tax=Laccaria bicolor (strain S238N-H82 / ATCC MYA-4686) TaxID=486041 RepID=B0D626_LACBS|nr:uncharacterized protein LACBIDRAFT_318132 [Laccaria bicolor S238N-H82]EDR10126.1 predicted protein [Laccaria bicolor S238N-H82]|eukprot:XP_001879511.1 predicted protein [Laccaria bicolor S238N-H82]
MAPGFLAVFSEPGTNVSLEEFQDWYNNEHIPLRLHHLPSFLTGARFSSSDSKTPRWLALYDITSTSTFSDESYTSLRTSRSQREADIVARLEVLDRRTCVLLADSGQSGVTTSLGAERPTLFLCTHGLELDVGEEDEEARGWAERSFGELGRNVDGWVRTRVFKVLDHGTAAKVSPYFVVHGASSDSERVVVRCIDLGVCAEFMFPDVSLNTTFREVVDKPFVSELREWVLYKAYPSIAQGNLGADAK